MPLLTRLFLPILLALTILDVAAAPMPTGNPYAAEVPVAGEDPAQRDEAIARALREVVVKVSGDPRSVSRLRAVRDPGDLVAQYQYGVAPGGVRVLRVAFDRAAVDALLRDEPAAAAAPALEPAVVASPGERVRVQVRGIGSLATHARVTRVLQAAAGPDGVALRAVRGDLALFEVSGRAGPDQLDRFAREGFLEPDYAPSLPGRSPAAGGEAFDGVRLRYRVMQ